MIATIQTLLLLLAVLVAIAVAARRFNTAPSILLVTAGILHALTPGPPRIELDLEEAGIASKKAGGTDPPL
jgi:monovalent cation/hydrogen antiporter